MNTKKIALIQGGLSHEREVSLQSAQSIAKALDELGLAYDFVEADLTLFDTLRKGIYSKAILAVHGRYAEDGILQSILEFLKIPYTGSGVLSSAICMNKVFTKKCAQLLGIKTAKYQVYRGEEMTSFECQLEFPLVVKPASEGSSVGTFICHDRETLETSLVSCSQFDNQVLIEEYIKGAEITVPYFNGKALTPVEVEPLEGFYDYKNKYTEGKTQHFLPPRLDSAIITESKKISEIFCQWLEVRTYARVDFLIKNRKDLYLMEVNTLPGFTSLSLLPESAAFEGISFTQLVKKLLDEARTDY